jgi:hypothetical protein
MFASIHILKCAWAVEEVDCQVPQFDFMTPFYQAKTSEHNSAFILHAIF